MMNKEPLQANGESAVAPHFIYEAMLYNRRIAGLMLEGRKEICYTEVNRKYVKSTMPEMMR